MLNPKIENSGILFTCKFCGLNARFSTRSFIEHLDHNHPSIEIREQKEEIRKISLAISSEYKAKQSVKEERAKLKPSGKNAMKKQRAESQREELEKFKKSVRIVLNEFELPKRFEKKFTSSKNLSQARSSINKGLKKSLRNKLVRAGINLKKKKEKEKSSLKSVRLIFTPMGNRR